MNRCPGLVELHERRGLAPDVRDLAGAILLAVVLDDRVDPLIEALAAGLGCNAELGFGDFLAACHDRRPVGAESIGLGAAAVWKREPPRADDRMVRRNGLLRSGQQRRDG
jgi:hypothetical protein